MRKLPPIDRVDRPVSNDDARAAFENIVASNSFSGSDRLIGFLHYVVEEMLEGRGDAIRGKSIALDFYGYKPDEIEQRESVVRVDAGRVRRKLQDYYDGEGKDNLVQIELPKGGYVPVFHALSEITPQDTTFPDVRAARRGYFRAGAALVGVCVIAIAIWQFQTKYSVSAVDTDAEQNRRSVLFDTSPQRLEAINLAQKGRELIFPAFDPGRLQAAMQIFETAINLDETYVGGYAGAAQLYGLVSVLTVDEVGAENALNSAVEHADKALDLSPTSAWAISARAWTEFASGDYDAALSWSLKAVQLAPQDPHVMEFHALISLYAGEFERVISDTARIVTLVIGEEGYVFQNARAAAYYHLQEYENSIASFEEAIETGAPMGPIPVAYMMAAHHYLGREDRAKSLVEKYVATWPDQRVDLLFIRLFRDAEFGEQLAQGMRAAGWEPN